jgi:hypothetical protein
MAGLDKWIYNFARRRKIPWVGLTGETVSAVTCMLKDSLNKITLCTGTTVPVAGTTGFAKGCIYIKTNATTKIAALLVNAGTSTSCKFVTPAVGVAGDATALAKTGDYTILLADIDTCAGRTVKIHVLAAQVVRALPATGEAIALNSAVVVTKYLNIAGVIGNYVELYCDGTIWHVVNYSGVVTKEA